MSCTRNIDKINFYYNINGVLLQKCNAYRDLGVIIDSTLSFVPHIEQMVNSSLRTVGFIIRNGTDFKDVFSIKILFYTLVRSKLEYCCIIWMPYYQVYINLVENVLRKIAKFIYFKMYGTYPPQHCDSRALFDIIGESSLQSRRNMACISFMQKLINGNISCTSILESIKFVCPRVNCRTPTTFYYKVPCTYHHFNSPLIRCLRLSNCIIPHGVDVFFDNFYNPRLKLKLLTVCRNF